MGVRDGVGVSVSTRIGVLVAVGPRVTVGVGVIMFTLVLDEEVAR